MKVSNIEKAINKPDETQGRNQQENHFLERVIRVFREEGFRGIWFKTLGEIIYRRLILVSLQLDTPKEKIMTTLPIEFSILGEVDLDEYVHFRPDQTESEISSRLMAGHLCFIGKYEGRIVYACWAARQVAHIDYLSLDLGLASDEIYTYDTYTLYSFRGKNIFPAGIEYTVDYFRKAGFRRHVGCVLPENGPAVRTLSKTGYLRFGLIGYIGMGKFRWKFRRHFKTYSPLL